MKSLLHDIYCILLFKERWIHYMKSKEAYLKDLENYGADMTKFKANQKVTEDKAKDNHDQTNGVTGTFRKLNIDWVYFLNNK